jgi:integrase
MARGNDGLRKRCTCPEARWVRCKHPWHARFQFEGREYGFSLHRVARRPRGYVMGKTEADALLEQLRVGVREGTFTAPRAATNAQAATQREAEAAHASRLTFGDVCERYLTGHVRLATRRQGAVDNMERHLAVLRRLQIPGTRGTTVRLEDKPFDSITKADIDAVVEARRAELGIRANGPTRRRPLAKSGLVGLNRLLARLRHLFNWAIAQGYVDATPFKRHGVTVVRLDMRAETPRVRRLEPGEEERLLCAANPYLRAVIVAALSTGCRIGELLGLRWSDVRWDEDEHPRWIVLPGARTKTYQTRRIPIGTRLQAELEMRRLDPNGTPLPPEAHVFGNAVGEVVKSVAKGWRLACARAGIAHLNFHDLRREFASRLLESGASEHDVRDFLGHANITTTSRYLQSSALRLERALAHMERSESRTNAGQNPEPHSAAPESPQATDTANPLQDRGLEGGGPPGDRTQDHMIKSHVLYH